MSRIRKVLAVVLGDTNGRGGVAALHVLQANPNLDILLVDDNWDAISQAQAVFSQYGRCSYIHSDISTKAGKLKVLTEIQKNGYWVQYLFNGYDCFNEIMASQSSKEQVNRAQFALNEAVYHITQCVFASMIKYANGRVDNISPNSHGAFLIKRYEAGTQIDHHTHLSGEVIMLLEGDYADEDGTSLAGEYIRNPPHSEHTPYSDLGCVMVISLHNIAEHDQAQLRVNVNAKDKWLSPCEGIKVMPIHQIGKEFAAFIRFTKESRFRPWYHFKGGDVIELPQSAYAQSEDLMCCERLILVQTNDYVYNQSSFSEYLAQVYTKPAPLESFIA